MYQLVILFHACVFISVSYVFMYSWVFCHSEVCVIGSKFKRLIIIKKILKWNYMFMSTFIFYILFIYWGFSLFLNFFLIDSFSLHSHNKAEMWCHAGQRDYSAHHQCCHDRSDFTHDAPLHLCALGPGPHISATLLATWGVITAAVCTPGQ